ncbi:hypothetical protein H6G20_15805 [Desertifilum sp. FACHB-1129]|uniref:hypothetical protein n=2 Tax=Desertifilaceae TaxID=1969992 RepID=UPI00114CE898|nr:MULTISPECIES: hypothetical protein [unclassified Desertifilum]MBD2313133.1 hypothetical protein [Desertifilum sp. FACHB-1129]MBD2324061.1 hypothetical protein [Desertifilum sp. FACHB-866]MBD2333996.1 hypothetical protein [Desertifilum sp. FACHB-868]MDA0212636.1 hypothetical protein [Cyanobacteria bacterium FC1]
MAFVKQRTSMQPPCSGLDGRAIAPISTSGDIKPAGCLRQSPQPRSPEWSLLALNSNSSDGKAGV